MKKTTLANFIILGLATWRLSHMLAEEDGPFSMFKKTREKARNLQEESKFFENLGISDGLECEWCNSMWIGGFFAFLYSLLGNRFLKLILPFSLSAFAVCVEHFLRNQEKR